MMIARLRGCWLSMLNDGIIIAGNSYRAFEARGWLIPQRTFIASLRHYLLCAGYRFTTARAAMRFSRRHACNCRRRQAD